MTSIHQTEFLSWDDTVIISENPIVNSGLSIENMLAAFKTEVVNLWQPLTLWSHQLDVSLFGLNPDLHHLSAVFYHLLAGLALYFALAQIKSATSLAVERSPNPLIPRSVAIVTTLLFLLHPMHVESWAWISERKDTLSALFAFLSLAFWARFISSQAHMVNDRGSARRACKLNYALSLLCLTCGLMSKPSLIVWPAVLLLTTHWQNPQKNLKVHLPIVKQLIPHLALCALVAGITYSFQLGRGEGVLKVIASRPAHENLAAGFNNIWIYCSKIFYPIPLSYFYPPLQTYPAIGATLGICLFGLLTYFSWKLRQSFPLLLWAWGSFFVVLAPVSGFIVSGEANAPDRYSYLAYTGPFLLLTTLAHRCLYDLSLSFQKKRMLATAATVAVLIPLGLLSFTRARAWKNMETLTAAAIQSHPSNYAPHHHLALKYLDQNQPQKALPHIKRALELREDNRYLWARLGIIEHQAGNADTAQKHFQKQILHAPNNLNAHIGLAKIYQEDNNYQAALPHLQKATQLAPHNPVYRQALKQCSDILSQ